MKKKDTILVKGGPRPSQSAVAQNQTLKVKTASSKMMMAKSNSLLAKRQRFGVSDRPSVIGKEE